MRARKAVGGVDVREVRRDVETDVDFRLTGNV